MDYKPHGKNKTILDRAFDLIESVPYLVSLRWIFYRLLQEAFYKNKDDYHSKWIPISAMARKRRYNGWRPDTLADDTRERINQVGWYASIEDAMEKLAKEISGSINITIDHFYRQEIYCEIWFEAKAMAGQFQHYTKGIDLVPFGGDPSIPYKYKIAKHLENCWSWYAKPLTVLTFGDCDKKGQQIMDTAERDVQSECSEPIEVIHCGLTLEQVQKYNLPENFEKPGQFQWEALEDWQAKEIIETALKSTKLDLQLIEECEKEGKEITELWRNKAKKWVERQVKKGHSLK